MPAICSETSRRLPWIDLFRGVAILLMVPANLAPHYGGVHPLWFKISSSLAAPMFVTISAGMVMFRGREHPLSYYLVRGLCIVLVGAMIDIGVWHVLPFAGFDVLYLIGLSMPVAFLCRRLPIGWHIASGAAIVAAAPVLRATFGYNRDALEISLASFALPTLDRVLGSWLVDGWFPVFPWLGIALLGAAYFRVAFASPTGNFARWSSGLGLLVTLSGLTLLFGGEFWGPGLVEFPSLLPRSDFIEVFYPAVTSYVITALGVVLFAAGILMRVGEVRSTGVLGFFGRYSMLIYVAHQALGVVLVGPLLAQPDGSQSDSAVAFGLANGAVFLIAFLLCLGVERLKRFRTPKNVFVQVVFGR